MTSAPRRQHVTSVPASRRGAALIIAIIVLAALLMLGLPFLFTQSASLTGTRAFAHSQSAYIGRDAAENLGVAAGALVMKTSFKGTTGTTGTEQWTSLVDKLVWGKGQLLTPPMPTGWAVMLGDNRVGLNLSTMPGFNGTPTVTTGAPAQGGVQTSDVRNTTVIGISIEDEAGKLDPNSLTVAGWDALLKQVGIDDWDDNQTSNSKVTMNGNNQWVQYYDDDNYGELAGALASVRLNLPGRRVTQLEQLLQADTLNWSGTQGSFSSPSSSPPTSKFGLRRPLTRSELDLLRPFLTLHNPSQGRSSANPNQPPPPFGLGKEAVIDVGTIAMTDPPSWTNGYAYTYFVDAQSVSVFDHSSPVMAPQSQPTLLGWGTWIITDQVDSNGPNRGIANETFRTYPGNGINGGSKVKGASVALTAQATNDVTNSRAALFPNAGTAGLTPALAIEAPPPVNLNAASVLVRALFGFPAQPALPTPFMTQDALKAVQTTLVANPFQQLTQNNQLLGINLQNPLSSSYIPALGQAQIIDKRLTELPPLGISSPGVFTVISGSATLDPQGHHNAQEIRRAVVQALPQEQVVERRWITQGHFYGLLSQRYGSQVETWPNPTRRLVQDTTIPTAFPDDPDLSNGGSPLANTGLRPAVQPNASTGFTNRTDSVIPPSAAISNAMPAPAVPVVGQGKAQHFLIDPTFTIDWRLPLGGDVATASAQLFMEKESGGTIQAAVIGGASYSAADLRPDGLLLKSSAPLAMELTNDLATDHGLLRRSSYTLQVPGQNLRSWEISGRHLDFWVTPQSDWTAGIIPILETRMPAGQGGGPIAMGGMPSGTGNSDLQNYVGLFYDTTTKLMVLIFAPPAIEHLADYGLQISGDDPTTPWLDERCLAISNTGQLAALAPAQVPDATPNGTSPRLSTVTPLFRPNRIVHCYKIPDRTVGGSTTPYFHTNQAVHIQVALANDRPGSSAIVIDGCVGRDVGRDPTAAGQLTQFGDHCALPALPLSTAIPLVTVSSTFATGLSTPATITVTPVAGLNAQDLFPKRGMIKIDDEYFTYQSITGNTFNGCVRGQRQNTNTNDPNPINRWPTTQAHAAGAYVTPGGYRLSLGYGEQLGQTVSLLTGNCTTGDILDNGFDPTTAAGMNPPPPPTLSWHIWDKINPKAIPPLMIDPTDPSGNTLILFPMAPTPTVIPLDPTQGVPINQWPKRGVIMINNQILSYSSISGNTLAGIADCTTWTFTPGLAPPLAVPGPITAIHFPKNNPPTVRLLTIEVAGDNPITPGKFVIPGNGTPALFQVMHTSGRVEWISYDHIANSPGQGNYFMVYNTGDAGFGYNNRGQVRTDFVGGAMRNPLFVTTLHSTTDTFPAGCTVLPVQTWFQPGGHCLNPGDVVTLLPFGQMQPGGAVPNQLQMVIRYVAIDGYASMDVVPNQNDTFNGWFALNDPVPPAYTSLDLSTYELLCWPGWTGDDLTTPTYTPLNPLGSPHGYLPRIDMLAQGFAPGGAAARTFLLATDSQRPGSTPGITPTANACLDGLAAGPLPAGNAKYGSSVAAWVSPSSVFNGATDSQPLLNGIDTTVGTMANAKVRTLDPVFVTPLGLIMIGGEVFAFDRNDNPAGAKNTEALLIGRALLGSSALTHSGKEFYSILPLGPVARLDQTLPTQAGFFQFYDYMQNGQPHWVNFDAPMAMLMNPSGTPAGGAGAQPQVELIPIIGPRIETHPSGQTNQPQWPWYLTVPWLRGMYNTVQQTWGPSGNNLVPIAVGWWPRYPSALPQSGLTSQHYRSRSYAWVGFPLSLNEARFDPTTFGSDPVATVSVLDMQTTGLFNLQAMALATGFDWTVAPPATLTNGAVSDQDVSAAFKQRQFTNVSVNGAELRVMWSYATPPSNQFAAIAAACNSAPMIGPVRLRALAPAKVLTVENAR